MKFNILSLLIISLQLTSCQPQPEEKTKRPNVLFIIADDLTTTALSCYGNELDISPNIDELASESVLFSKAYSQYPVCGPSRLLCYLAITPMQLPPMAM